MPFDPEIGIDTDPLRTVWHIESDGNEFVPDVQHINEHVVLNVDGSIMSMIVVPSYAYELESMKARNVRRRQINALLKGIADDNVTIAFHLIHHDRVEPFRYGLFRRKFSRQLFAKYQKNVLSGRLVSNDWFITIIVSPRFAPMRAFKNKMSIFTGKKSGKASTGAIRKMNDTLQSLMSYFGKQGARRLGYRTCENGYIHSEIAEARSLIISGRWKPVPLTTGTLADSIYTERVTCGTVGVRIDGLDGPRYAKTIALKDYPSGGPKEGGATKTGQFSHFVNMKEPFPFVMAQTFRFQARDSALWRLYLKGTRMGNALDSQERGMRSLEDASEEVASGESPRGHHNFGLTVFGRDLPSVQIAAGAAGSAINAGGAVPIAEDANSFAAFWSMLTGNDEGLEGRSGSISLRNFTAMASLEGYPTGAKSGHWGPPTLRFATNGNTAYDFDPFVQDVGHAAFIGRSTSGKTLLMLLLAVAQEQAMNEDDRVFYLDKDQAAEPAIRAMGGAYLTLKSGQDSGLSPLRGLSDTPENQTFLVRFISNLMLSDNLGPLSSHTTKRLRRAVARQMRMEPKHRGLSAVRAFLGYGAGTDGSRLDRWCEGGTDGWLFDGEHDEVRVNAMYVGFDLTQLFDHPACSHVAAYIMQRIHEVIDGRRVTVICDEVRKYLLSDAFAEEIQDFSLTLRKKNGQLWIAGQEPVHIANPESRIGMDLIGQCRTVWAFSAKDGNFKDYERLGFTKQMYEAITEKMPVLGYRSVLLVRESGSAILRTELEDMQAEIDVLSGREETVRLIPEIRNSIGDDPDLFFDEFAKSCENWRNARSVIR